MLPQACTAGNVKHLSLRGSAFSERSMFVLCSGNMEGLVAVLSLLLLSAFAASLSTNGDPDIFQVGGEEDLGARSLFESWMMEHDKVYSGDSEKENRYRIFLENLQYINKRNSENGDYRLKLNMFADLNNTDFREKYVGKFGARQRNRTSSNMHELVDTKSLPTSVDWRTSGAVTAVKNQGSCGSCWAFSAVAAVESMNYLVTGDLVSLSEQQLVDCDTEYDEGCSGGLMDDAFEYIIKNGGISTEEEYPYKARDGSCNSKKEKDHAVTIDSFVDVQSKNEDALLKAVASTAVSVAIEAAGRGFQFYGDGVFTGECGTDLDHGVTVVGYGTATNGKKYWIIKNSWGSSWGENGYIRMERLGQGDGLCGINIEPSYPTKYRDSPAGKQDT